MHLSENSVDVLVFVLFSRHRCIVVVVVLQSNLNRLIHQFDDWLSVVSMKAHVFVLNGPNGATNDTVGGVVVVGSFFFSAWFLKHIDIFSFQITAYPPSSSTFIPPLPSHTHTYDCIHAYCINI